MLCLAFSFLIVATTLPPLFCQRNETRILVVYYSQDGHTQALAKAVADGAGSVRGASVRLKSVADASTADVLDSDAIIVGSPVYNANVAPAVQEFINSWPFEGAPLRDKIGAAFVTAGGISAGEEITQLNILHSMLIFGMIVVGGPEWKGAFGASAVTAETPFESENGIINPAFAQKGKALGERVARIAMQLAK